MRAMTENLPNSEELRNKKTASEMGKLQDIRVKQMEEQDKLKPFEKMASLLGITVNQYLAMEEFEKFYKSRQSKGLKGTENNSDVVIAKELFGCWDRSRLGHVNLETLAENLISFGLAMDKEQVVKLLQLLSYRRPKLGQDEQKTVKTKEQINLRDFIKIFERNKFSERAIEIIKQQI